MLRLRFCGDPLSRRKSSIDLRWAESGGATYNPTWCRSGVMVRICGYVRYFPGATSSSEEEIVFVCRFNRSYEIFLVS